MLENIRENSLGYTITGWHTRPFWAFIEALDTLYLCALVMNLMLMLGGFATLIGNILGNLFA